jgi:hypothetical protein
MIAKVVVEERSSISGKTWHKSESRAENLTALRTFYFSSHTNIFYCRSSENQDCMLYIEPYQPTCVEQADCDKHSRSNSDIVTIYRRVVQDS